MIYFGRYLARKEGSKPQASSLYIPENGLHFGGAIALVRWLGHLNILHIFFEEMISDSGISQYVLRSLRG